MYKVIGKDGRESGPIEREELRRWIFEHRVIETSMVKAEGSDVWVPIGKTPEFAEFFSGGSAAPKSSIPTSTAGISEALRGTHPLCIWGFCFSIASFVICCFGLPLGVAGFILSLLGLVTVVKDPRYKGKMLAIIGIIVSLLVIFSSSLPSRNGNGFHFYRQIPMPPGIHLQQHAL